MTFRDLIFGGADLILRKGTIGTAVDIVKSKDWNEFVSFAMEDPRYAEFPEFQLAPYRMSISFSGFSLSNFDDFWCNFGAG